MELKVLSTRENQVMDILWGSDSSLSALQISEKCKEMSVYSVQQVIKRLLKLELIKIEHIGHSGKVLTRFYSPVISQPEYVCFLLGNSKKNIFQFASYIITNDTNGDMLDELKKLIDEKQKEIGE